MGKDSGGGGNTYVQAPPAVPDYASAAAATAAGNREAAIAGTEANRVNQYTPYGNLTYNQYGKSEAGNPLWSATQTLSPAEQAKLDANNNLTKSLLGTAQTGLSNVNTLLSGNNTNLDESKLAQSGIQGQAVQDAIMTRLRPELEYQQKGLNTTLANQGIMEGSEAYNRAQTQQGQKSNDLMTQAALSGINTGQAARQQGISEQYMAQSRPLDVVNALRTGSQVNNPQFANVPQQANVSGPDLLGAAQASYKGQIGQYNAAQAQANANNNFQQAQQNNMTNGLMGLASAGISAYSDRRLKENIVRIGTHILGIGIYAFDYIWGEHAEGVMADEVLKVMPEAVSMHDSGYMMVDYGMLNHG